MLMGCDLRGEFMLRDKMYSVTKGNSRKAQNCVSTVLFILTFHKYNSSLCVQHFEEASNPAYFSPD